nr:immunoglobulin light chain junction region [Macaca mulatta]MOX98428.1 immunoglobulin light chain junction region [Macaca mulatta]MOX98996.1 immunoglobulin light chain junction region [Macaca mulatta]MOX99297.1 immunoglobulin light chain junction region [Macaca mulatta]MOX99419.1 immunoglobulin light chain junction region [Macaca mulatta]
CLQSANSPYSF